MIVKKDVYFFFIFTLNARDPSTGSKLLLGNVRLIGVLCISLLNFVVLKDLF